MLMWVMLFPSSQCAVLGNSTIKVTSVYSLACGNRKGWLTLMGFISIKQPFGPILGGVSVSACSSITLDYTQLKY